MRRFGLRINIYGLFASHFSQHFESFCPEENITAEMRCAGSSNFHFHLSAIIDYLASSPTPTQHEHTTTGDDDIDDDTPG